jgi:hypothetical protein
MGLGSSEALARFVQSISQLDCRHAYLVPTVEKGGGLLPKEQITSPVNRVATISVPRFESQSAPKDNNPCQ